MKRREFFLKTGAAISLLSIGSLTYLYTYDDSEKGISNPFIQDFLSKNDISNIINEYLKEEKEEKNHTELKEQSLDEIKNKIREDFISDNIKICDGWVLSETELKYLIKNIDRTL